jgi:SPP1 gp7 family putative phage head morphogenesis protein
MALPIADLRDTLTRHKVYLDQVKTFEGTRFNVILGNLLKDLSREFRSLSFATMDEMSKAQLMTFLRKIQGILSKQFNSYVVEIINRIRAFMEVDYTVLRDIFEAVDGRKLQTANKEEQNELFLGWLSIAGTARGFAAMWGRIANAPIPATGQILPTFVSGNVSPIVARSLDIIRKGYANKAKPADVLKEFTGTKENNFKDGAMATFSRQNQTMLRTVYQHVSQMTQAAIASAYYRCYEWVSVLDDRTTKICRSRDGNVYVYGYGPLPPAHPNCRSDTIPSECDGKNKAWDATYYSWIKRQPARFQDDALGKTKADDLRSGRRGAKDYPKYTGSSGISPEAFKRKLPIILMKSGSAGR